MRNLWCVTILSVALAGSVQAQECASIEALTDTSILSQSQDTTCSDPPDPVCRWTFAYRADAAVAAFEHLAEKLTRCLGPPVDEDAPVNHPDSYRLVQFGAPDAVISLSLKDKASLQSTFVFLRVDNFPD